MRHCIILYGNICAGKSTISKLLLEKLSNYQVFDLDQYRIKYGGTTQEHEKRAQNMFFKEFQKADLAIYESVSIGRTNSKVNVFLTTKRVPTLKVLIDTNMFTCIDRFKERGHVAPSPHKFEIVESTGRISRSLMMTRFDLKVDGKQTEQIKKAIEKISSLSKEALSS